MGQGRKEIRETIFSDDKIDPTAPGKGREEIMKTIEAKLYEIEKDGLPNMDKLTGRVAFIWDGAIFSGWPLYDIHIRYPENNHPVYGKDVWECSENRASGIFRGVTHYIIFEKPMYDYEKKPKKLKVNP